MKGVRVLVTGAGGFVGSHLVEELVSRGATVRAFVRYNSRSDWGLIEELPAAARDAVEVVAGDLRDEHAVRNATREAAAVFHLAALVGIPYSFVHPREVVETNVLGTLNVLQAALEHGVGRMVHLSTSEVYGTAREAPMKESHPLHPQSPYAASKVGADQLAASFRRTFGLSVAIARPFNIYGPRQSARAIIPAIAVQAMTRDRVEIGSPHPTRDLTYVTDTVAGLIRLAEVAGVPDEVIHLGSNFEIAIGELAAKIVAATGRKVDVVSVPERIRPAESEVERLWADSTRARDLLGWSPRVPLDEGLARTVRWIADNLERYKSGIYAV
jgi:NAD dependent epimerase/dehydratase